MKKRMLTLLTALGMTLSVAALAQALPSQTFVASTGNDANDCTQSTPCRTFAGAVPKTVVKGVITAIDSSTYGVVTIDKSLTIQAAPGVYAVVQGGRADDGVTISAGSTDVVVLRNLQIVTQSIATNKGVVINTVGTLHVESCIITGFKDSGIGGPGVCNAGVCPELFVIDTILRDNFRGMYIRSGNVTVDHCRVEDNTIGILIQEAKVTIRDSVVGGNAGAGVTVIGTAGSPAGGGMENCLLTRNGIGLVLNGTASNPYFYVSTTMIVSNDLGLQPNGGHLFSFGNNRMAGNGLNGAFTDTIVTQ